VIDARLQPHLANGLVTLAPLVEEDWASIYAVSSDPLIWAGHPARDRWCEPVFRRFFADALASGEAMAERDVATGAVCGSSRYDVRRARATRSRSAGHSFRETVGAGGPMPRSSG
jgi:hypothetical protein